MYNIRITESLGYIAEININYKPIIVQLKKKDYQNIFSMTSLELLQKQTNKPGSGCQRRCVSFSSFHFITSRLKTYWSWEVRPWKQEVEDICDYTILLKDVHLTDLHSFRLADIIISVVKWVFLWMVYELYTRWLNAAWKIKLCQALQPRKYWLAPAPVLKVNRWSLATPQDCLPSELTPVNCHSQVSSYSCRKSHNVSRTNASSSRKQE